MHTLPFTCNQIAGLIVIGLSTLCILSWVYLEMPAQVVATFVFGFIGAVIGLVYGVEWLDKNVRCKCSK